MKKLITVIILLCLLGCKSLKEAAKVKTNLETTALEDEQRNTTNESKKVTERTVEGGTLKSDIIPLEKRERDASGAIKELIDEIKDGGLTKTIYYKPDGSVSVECKLAEMFERIQEENRQTDNSIIKRVDELAQQIKAKDSSKEVEMKDSFIWVMGLVVLVVLIVGQLLVYKLINKRLALLEGGLQAIKG